MFTGCQHPPPPAPLGILTISRAKDPLQASGWVHEGKGRRRLTWLFGASSLPQFVISLDHPVGPAGPGGSVFCLGCLAPGGTKE